MTFTDRLLSSVSSLARGAVVEGPAIIEEKTSTTVLYPGQTGEVDEYLNIEIAVG